MAFFDDLILAGRESASLEYKQSAPWEDLRLGLIRTVLGLSNTRNGGTVVIGIAENADGTFSPEGVSPTHLATFPTEEDFRAAVNGFAEPFVEPSVDSHIHEDKAFLVVSVPEFRYEPVLCTRTEGRLREGALYIRSARKPETTDVRTVTDMRALVSLVREKALTEWLREFTAAGGQLLGPPAERSASDEFERELGDL